jgi:hypothetical protein
VVGKDTGNSISIEANVFIEIAAQDDLVASSDFVVDKDIEACAEVFSWVFAGVAVFL